MKVALVHDYLREYGGAERVLEAIHDMFPSAPLYTAYYNSASLGKNASKFKGWDIKTSFIQNLPFANKLISPLRIFAPVAFENFDLKEYDLVISSSAIYFAKAVITSPQSLHIGYIHTPPRYLYGYTTSFNYKKHFLTKVFGELANHFLRLYDFETSQRPDILVANSKNTLKRIQKFYRRDAQVIYPPVDLSEFKKVKKEKGDYFLSLGRLVRGKGVDVVIEASNRSGVVLKVAGNGPELEELKKKAGKNIEFLGGVSDEERVVLLSKAKALVVASEDEDFGITNIEALAAGTPVIALKAGGYLETVIDGNTGEFFEGNRREEVIDNLAALLKSFNPNKYKEADLKKQAEKFSKEEFQKKLLDLIKKNIKV